VRRRLVDAWPNVHNTRCLSNTLLQVMLWRRILAMANVDMLCDGHVTFRYPLAFGMHDTSIALFEHRVSCCHHDF
jgi:hypothetical protein